MFSLQHLLASSLKNNPSIRSRFGDEHFLQRCSPSTHPLPGASWGEAGNEVPKAETLSLWHGTVLQQKPVRSHPPHEPEPWGAAGEGVMAAWSPPATPRSPTVKSREPHLEAQAGAQVLAK